MWGAQGPEKGRDLPEVTQQIRAWGQGVMPLSSNRMNPLLLHFGGRKGDPGPQRESPHVGWDSARLPLPLEHRSGHPPQPHSGHPSSIKTSAGLGTGPAPGNPLQAGRSQQAWRLQVQEASSLTVQLRVPLCPASVLWGQTQRPREVQAFGQSHTASRGQALRSVLAGRTVLVSSWSAKVMVPPCQPLRGGGAQFFVSHHNPACALQLYNHEFSDVVSMAPGM